MFITLRSPNDAKYREIIEEYADKTDVEIFVANGFDEDDVNAYTKCWQSKIKTPRLALSYRGVTRYIDVDGDTFTFPARLPRTKYKTFPGILRAFTKIANRYADNTQERERKKKAEADAKAARLAMFQRDFPDFPATLNDYEIYAGVGPYAGSVVVLNAYPDKGTYSLRYSNDLPSRDFTPAQLRVLLELYRDTAK